MKIPPAQIESFIAKLDPVATRAVLVYGPDTSIIGERVKSLSRKIADESDPFGVVDISYDKLKSDPALLADEMAALSFSGSRKLIRVDASSVNSLDASLKAILENSPGDNFVIFSGGELPPSSSLRKFFEGNTKHVAALACYSDDVSAQRRLLQSLMTEKGLSASPQVLDSLQERLPVDRRLVKSELEKLQLYQGDEMLVTEESVYAVISANQESSMDGVAKAIASLDQKNVEQQTQQLLKEGTMPIALLRSVSRYFTRLHHVKGGMANGTSEADMMKAMRPPVFFKEVPLFKRHLTLWSLQALAQVLQAIEKAEKECKKAAMPVETICTQLFTLLPIYARQYK